jgi:ATPase subunit of ABC transporter with duplicated ATPase domains
LATAELVKHQKITIEKKMQKDQMFIDKFRASTRSRQAMSRQKRLEKIEVPEIKRTSRVAPKFLFQQKQKSGREVLEVSALSQAFNNTKLFQNLFCKVQRGEKIAILGQNGVGKSTLLKTILSIIPPAEGKIKWGYNVVTSYFSQDHHDLINGDSSVLEWLISASGISEVEKVRSELGKMLFTQDDAKKPVSVLSGGESTRLLFAKIIIDKPNVILLDEPTNHLDLESRLELAATLQRFDGTIIFVSHDRSFISSIANRIIFLHPDGFIDFHGRYEHFRQKYSKYFEE